VSQRRPNRTQLVLDCMAFLSTEILRMRCGRKIFPASDAMGWSKALMASGKLCVTDLTQAEPTLCCATEADGLLQYLTSKRGMLRWRLQLQRGIVVIHKWVPKFQSLFCMR